jgi:hypothetical protein
VENKLGMRQVSEYIILTLAAIGAHGSHSPELGVAPSLKLKISCLSSHLARSLLLGLGPPFHCHSRLGLECPRAACVSVVCVWWLPRVSVLFCTLCVSVRSAIDIPNPSCIKNIESLDQKGVVRPALSQVKDAEVNKSEEHQSIDG